MIRHVSISSTFYISLFGTKLFFEAFLYSHFGFEIFWQKYIGTKAAHKMLMKLNNGVSSEKEKQAEKV